MKENLFKKLDVFILTVVLIIAIAFRLYKIDTPLADFHSWRQADTAAVARNFVNMGFDLIHPKYDDLSNVQSGKDNPQGYRMVEFPIYNAIFAGIYKLSPNLPIEVWGRITTIFFSLVIIAIIYYLTLKEIGRLAAFWAATIYSVFPFFVFFSRVVLPETTASGLTFISIFFLYLNPTSPIFYILSAIFMASALLVKPTVIFFFLPLAYIFYNKHKNQVLKKPFFYIYFILAAIPLIWWRTYINNYPEGIPASDWLITSVNTATGMQIIFFRPAFFRWVFYERINNLILGGLSAAFFILGCFLKQKKNLMITILLASLGYLLVFQGGNVQHVYYQTLILPAVAIYMGIGIAYISTLKKKPLEILPTYGLLFAILGFSWFVSFYQVKDYYGYSPDLVQSAKIINSLTTHDDKIVTDNTGDTTLLYLSDRRGAPAVYKDPIELKKLGYSYITTTSPDLINQLKKDGFQLIFGNEKLTIFKL